MFAGLVFLWLCRTEGCCFVCIYIVLFISLYNLKYKLVFCFRIEMFFLPKMLTLKSDENDAGIICKMFFLQLFE